MPPSQVTAILMVVAIAPLCLGCATTSVLGMGARHEVRERYTYDNVYLKGNEMWLEYSVYILHRDFGAESRTPNVKRWSSVELDRLPWKSFSDRDFYSIRPDSQMVAPGSDTRPVQDASLVQMPIGLPQNPSSQVALDTRAAVRKALETRPVAVWYHYDNGSGCLDAAANAPVTGQGLGLARVCVPTRADHHTWWSYPLWVVAIPTALVVDVITSPVQILFWIGLAGMH